MAGIWRLAGVAISYVGFEVPPPISARQLDTLPDFPCIEGTARVREVAQFEQEK